MPRQLLGCPGCRRLDQVQKVSALVRAGSAFTSGTGRATGRFGGSGWNGAQLTGMGGSFSATTETSGEHSSALSQALAPPNEPHRTDRLGLPSMLLLILALVVGWLALATVPGLHCAYDPPNLPVRTACWDSRGGLVLEMQAGQMPNPAVQTRVVGGCLIALLVVVLACLAVLRSATGRRRRRRFRDAHQAWEQAYERWQRFYYCHRCDGVFEPGDTASLVPTPEMLDHLSFAEA